QHAGVIRSFEQLVYAYADESLIAGCPARYRRSRNACASVVTAMRRQNRQLLANRSQRSDARVGQEPPPAPRRPGKAGCRRYVTQPVSLGAGILLARLL